MTHQSSSDKPISDEVDKYLSEKYYSPENAGSFSGVKKIWGNVKYDPSKPKKLTLKKLKTWVNLQNVHLMHKQNEKKFPTEKHVFDYIDQQWGADLVIIGFPEENRGYQNILVVMDLFSRFMFARGLKGRSSTEVGKAFSNILESSRHCDILETDGGGEFRGKTFQDILSTHGIRWFQAFGEHKVSIVERGNRTLENLIFKYFYENQTHNFIDILQKFVNSYNNTVHSFLKMKPSDITPENSFDTYKKVYMPIVIQRGQHPTHFTFSIGDLVRLTRAREPFARGYHTKYTEELFRVVNRIPSHPPRYRVSDLNGRVIHGSFYQQELLKYPQTNSIDTISFKIEKILKSKTVKGKKYFLVRWLGYSQAFDSWVQSSHIKKYKGKI